jgi:hypothetical protein
MPTTYGAVVLTTVKTNVAIAVSGKDSESTDIIAGVVFEFRSSEVMELWEKFLN